MSATRSFTPLAGGGTAGAVIPNDPLKANSGTLTVEQIRQALDMALYLGGHQSLGGDENAILSASFVPVNAAMSYDLNGDTLGGLTLDVVMFYYTSNAATTVDVRLRNTTDSSDAATLAAPSASTTVVRTARTVTMASGVKTYQLQVAGSDAVYPVTAWGYLRLRKVAA